MTHSDSQPFFSIVIPTRDRADLFKHALDSVLAQTCESREVIVVNDGSTGEELDKYKALESEYPSVRFLYLVHRPNGHGQSYAMNYGASVSRSRYVGFLDDDDYWTDTEHLSRAKLSLAANPDTDVYYSNQAAYFADGSLNENPVWLDYLNDRLDRSMADEQGSIRVEVPLLLSSVGFAHLNCSIFRREFFESINGLDENIRYENDRDLFIRTVDSAKLILMNPAIVSRHHIPDLHNKANMSTIVSANQKRVYQLYFYEKSALFAQNPLVRDYCRRGKGNVLKHIADEYAQIGSYKMAAYYAKQALAVLPTWKWRAYTFYLSMRSLLS
jgi:glycosyltransferase involved in cell wall biosynthesis